VEDNIVNGKPLVYLEYVSNYKVEDAGQVILLNCSNITVENQDLTNISVGIVLLGTEGSIISNNTVSNNSLFGIHLKSSSSNTISGNTVCYNDDDGIRLVSSRNSTISGNTVCYNDDDGIRLDSSCNSTITGNTICNNRLGGIGLFHSSNSTIAANNVCNNSGGITLSYSSNNNTITSNTFVNDGLFVYDSYQNRVEDNRVNSKPLVYLEDVSNYKVEDTGQVILVNCNNITVENLDLSDTYVGIGLWETEDSTISNNRVCNNSYGIDLFFSSNNTITGNTICNNYDDCIFLLYSSNNKIYLNNFINNSYNFYSEESTNIWNSKGKITYTHNGSTFTNYLGNYWSNYKEKYPDGEGIDGTGILDTPYSINSDKDNYPLMEPWENYFIYPVVSPEKVEINTKVEAGETVIHYENRSFWKESDLLKILENKEEFESTMIENFNEDLSKYCKKREYAADVEFEEARKLTVFKCEVHNAITKSDNMYRATFIWLLRPLGLDFIDDNFEKTKDGLSREGTINNIPTNISLIFPPQKSVYAAWQHPIGHCHAHVWWIVYVFE
jgi:parallel beta-helix repeat protein